MVLRPDSEAKGAEEMEEMVAEIGFDPGRGTSRAIYASLGRRLGKERGKDRAIRGCGSGTPSIPLGMARRYHRDQAGKARLPLDEALGRDQGLPAACAVEGEAPGRGSETPFGRANTPPSSPWPRREAFPAPPQEEEAGLREG